MNDQAEQLRRKLRNGEDKASAKTIAVISGKGGVGKSNFSLNFSLSLQEKGHDVLLLDLDIGMGNIDVLLGLASPYSAADYFAGNASLEKIISVGPHGLHYIAGGTGLSQLAEISAPVLDQFFLDFSELFSKYEYIILDMGAGISSQSLHFILSVNELIAVTTPEPTSLTDAYAALKFIHLRDNKMPISIVVNKAETEKEAASAFNRISQVMESFLGKRVTRLGAVPDDRSVQQAVRKQTPYLLYKRSSAASRATLDIADYFLQLNGKQQADGKVPFMSRLKQLLFEKGRS
ncbi:MinD/ParA family protein [Bacillus infantis]|uniref:MinD/ParA family protein n=1 Tax=Bacillus infantis TaxID=324767 RepID=UPI00101D693A|nr:MinD/ParA family protein [Bacillus infantis]RYI32116.1 MinD/ParA family protein [Bacillus infantis]